MVLTIIKYFVGVIAFFSTFLFINSIISELVMMYPSNMFSAKTDEKEAAKDTMSTLALRVYTTIISSLLWPLFIIL